MTDTNSKAQVTDAMVEAAVDSICSPFPSASISIGGDVDRWRDIMRAAVSAALAAQEKPEPVVAVEEAALQAVVDAMMMEQGSANVIRQKARNIIKAYRSALAHPSPDLPEGEVETTRSRFGRLFPMKTQAEIDNDPAYRYVQAELKPLRDTIEKISSYPSPIDKGEVK